MIRIQKLDKDKIPQVANIHRQFLSSGFMASFGLIFLEKFYETLLNSEDIFTFIAIDGQGVLGFVTATSNVKYLPRLIITNLWKEVLIMVIKNPPLILKILQLPFYPSFNDKNSNCEILSIAVVPSARRHGLGKKLIFASKSEFKRRKFKKFQLSARDSMEEANIFYKKIGLKKIKSAKFLQEKINFWQGNLV